MGAEKDMRAVLAEAKAALEECTDGDGCLFVLGGDNAIAIDDDDAKRIGEDRDRIETRARAAAKAIGEVITECPAQLAASDPNCPYDGGACSVHTRDSLAAARSEHPQTRDARDMGACVLTFRVLHEALLAGGYSASRIVERLREVGIANASVTHLHHVGLQDIANALCGEVLEVPSDEAHSPAALSPAEARDLQARLVQAEESADRYSGDAREAEAQLAREREAVDGLLAVLAGLSTEEAWQDIFERIEAVRKSREGAGSSPPDERLGWAAEIRARASPCLELRGLELHDSGEQTVGPRVVAVPDCEGWWARKETRRVEWLYVEPIAETGDEGAPTVLSTWVSAFRRHFPIAEMSGPGIEWSGPFTLPEGWA